MGLIAALAAVSPIPPARAAEPSVPPDLSTVDGSWRSAIWLDSHIAATVKMYIESRRYDEALAILDEIIEAGKQEGSFRASTPPRDQEEQAGHPAPK